MKQEQKLALVTGANRGLGLALSKALALAGWRVILGCRDLPAGELAARALTDQGLSAQAMPLDLQSQADLDRLAQSIATNPGRLDLLVNNAGILNDARLGEPASVFDADLDKVRQSLEINTLAPLRLINKLIPLMRAAGQARIINMSSGMGQLSEMGGQYPGYRISKTALNAVTAIVAAELGDSDIVINSVCPGWVRTDMGGSAAELDVEQGIDTALWLATEANPTLSGGFYRERQLIDW